MVMLIYFQYSKYHWKIDIIFMLCCHYNSEMFI